MLILTGICLISLTRLIKRSIEILDKVIEFYRWLLVLFN